MLTGFDLKLRHIIIAQDTKKITNFCNKACYLKTSGKGQFLKMV